MKVDFLPTNARFTVTQLIKIGGGHLYPCVVLMQEKQGFTKHSVSSTKGCSLTQLTWKCFGAASAPALLAAHPLGQAGGHPQAATFALLVKTVECGKSLQCGFKQPDTEWFIAYARVK